MDGKEYPACLLEGWLCWSLDTDGIYNREKLIEKIHEEFKHYAQFLASHPKAEEYFGEGFTEETARTMAECQRSLEPPSIMLNRMLVPLDFRKTIIKYTYSVEPDEDGEWVEQEAFFLIESKEGSLNQLEMLFQIHQKTYPILKDQDHKFLEYLELWGELDDIPIYEMILGS